APLTTPPPRPSSSIVETNFQVVVFPLPFGPHRTKTLPQAPLNETSSRARVSPLLSFPLQLTRAGRWRKILLTDSSTMLFIATIDFFRMRRTTPRKNDGWKPCIIVGTIGIVAPIHIFKDSTAHRFFWYASRCTAATDPACNA